ncbi:MAG: chromosome segregation protein SMC, partial [Pseudomonadota bacterium]|nr:chromosome segregation protein SMC [Pseudomonadota bacterium]
MKLTRLKIHGFKSFVDAADIPIQPGVTGIVGPNGCGKSNLVEALRFVMGESSYKAMRGGGMDDVIFSGSGNRPPRNIAEVTIVCERDPGEGAAAGASPHGAHGPEILEVARRIERDSGSTYRINGREARARDVQLLFADAATGAHSSALVRQGQIAELIAAKPAQRRGILEDAAGISGLHSRRGEAEGRLKAAEANLLRLDDVMSEIASSLEALRRQARQASRYRKLSEEIRGGEALLFALQWEAAVARHGEAEAALAAAVTRFAAAAAHQAETAKIEAVAARRLPELRDKAAAANATLQRVRLAAQELDREEASRKTRREELAVRRAQAQADLKHESEIGADAAAATARIDAEEAKLLEDGAHSGERIAAARLSAEAAAAAVMAVEAEFTTAAGLLAAASAERAALDRANSELRVKLRRLDDERLAIVAERDRLHGEFGGEAAAQAAAAAFAEAEAALAEREAESLAAEIALEAARETERSARAPFEAAERSHGALQAEARTLTHLLDIDKSKRSSPLIDSLDVAPGYEKALVAALGDDLDISVDPEAAAHWGTCGSGDGDADLPNGAAPLSEFVRGPEAFARRLRQIGVVTEDTAASLLPSLAAGQRLVTLDGGLWRWDGLKAQPGSAATAARRLESRNRVAFLVQELRAARHDVETTSELFEQARQVRAGAERIEASGRNAVRDARRIVEARRATALDAERHASRIAGRLSAFSGA